jgi:hypothetical protein
MYQEFSRSHSATSVAVVKEMKFMKNQVGEKDPERWP